MYGAREEGNTKKIWQIVKYFTGIGDKEYIIPDNLTCQVADNFNS